MQPELTEHLRRGLSDLRTGALLNLIAYAIILIAVLSFLPLVLLPYMSISRIGEISRPLGMIISALVSIGIVILVAVIMFIISFYYFFRSTGHFKSFDPKLGIGRTGMMLQLMGLIILIIGLLAFLMLSAITKVSATRALGETHGPFILIFAMLGVMFIAAVISFIGGLLFGVMLTRLGEVEGLSEFRTAGILYIVALVLSVIPFISLAGMAIGIVAMILIYTYSGRGLRSIESSRSAPPATGQSQPAGGP